MASSSVESLRAVDSQPMDTNTAEELENKFEKLTIKETVEVEAALQNIYFETAMAKEKLSIIEKRIMNNSIELHECIRQIKYALDSYNDTKSDLSWFSSVIIRELNQFELAERRRLSFDVQAAFVLVENCKDIVQKKVELIFVAVVIQAKMELSHHDDALQNPVEKVGNDWQMTRLRNNLKYFIEIIAPFAMHLKGLPLIEQTVDGMWNKYRQLNRELKCLENYIVSPYNNERSVMDVAEWDEKNGEYKLKSEMKDLVEALGAGRVSKKLCVEAS
jgi:hypothetical protein